MNIHTIPSRDHRIVLTKQGISSFITPLVQEEKESKLEAKRLSMKRS